ncbi:hypothetical protein [Nocardioides sp. WS12]|uniref:hypothetical protein n=1 Tax=Nocardioides sp. WS12 TaxID=2486272 RepID=UPI0015FBADF0|nr:hypothetical protein [Nocardioides sp. WS12]
MTRAWATWTGIAGLAVDAVLAVVGWLVPGEAWDVEGESTYPDEVLVDEPLLYWRLPSAEDVSGNGNHGTYVAGVIDQIVVYPDSMPRYESFWNTHQHRIWWLNAEVEPLLWEGED